MRKRNVLVLAILLALIVLAVVLSQVIEYAPAAPENADAAAKGYIYVTAAGEGRWFELPEEETSFQLSRADDNGNEIKNVVRVMPNGVYMESSTCDNQDCVHQGTVTLENRKERVLSNMILCLPNDVTIALYSAEEVTALMQGGGQ